MNYGVKDVVFIDVRDSWENKGKHLDNSISIPFNKLTFDLEKTLKDKSAPMFIFCSTGTRCKVAKEYMNELGYGNIVGIGTVEDAMKARRELYK